MSQGSKCEARTLTRHISALFLRHGNLDVEHLDVADWPMTVHRFPPRFRPSLLPGQKPLPLHRFVLILDRHQDAEVARRREIDRERGSGDGPPTAAPSRSQNAIQAKGGIMIEIKLNRIACLLWHGPWRRLGRGWSCRTPATLGRATLMMGLRPAMTPHFNLEATISQYVLRD
jgi:hypothetical protein